MKKEVKLYCSGVVIFSNNKPSKAFRLVNDDGTLSDEIVYFSGKSLSLCWPGQVYKVEADLEKGGVKTIYGRPEFHEVYGDEKQRAEDRITSEANQTVITAMTQSKKAETSKSDILNVLKPLRRAYDKTNALGRIAIEVRVLQYLRNNNDLYY